MNNIRKKHINNTWEIDLPLRVENPQRARMFEEASDRIKNDELIVDFWNLLVDYKKYDKEDLLAGKELATLVATATTGVLLANGNTISTGITALSTLALAVSSAVNNFHDVPKAGRIQAALEAMRIIEPELYNVELCFNKAPMHLIPMVSDGTNPEAPKDGLKYEPNFEGKDRYIELHNKLVKNKKLFVSDIDEDFTILVNDKDKKNEDDNVTYECELPQI